MRKWKVGASVCPVCVVSLKHMSNKTVVFIILVFYIYCCMMKVFVSILEKRSIDHLIV